MFTQRLYIKKEFDFKNDHSKTLFHKLNHNSCKDSLIPLTRILKLKKKTSETKCLNIQEVQKKRRLNIKPGKQKKKQHLSDNFEHYSM